MTNSNMLIIKSELSNSELLEYIYKAADVYEDLIGKNYLIIGQFRKRNKYEYFECMFLEENFMHLMGLKSKTMSAVEFYQTCVNYNHKVGTGLTINDCSPSREKVRLEINRKVSCAYQLLQIKQAKKMSIGNKDKISQYNNFDFAYGLQAIIGFRYINSNIANPTTLLPTNICEHCSSVYPILFIFEKLNSEELYSSPIMERKSGIFQSEYKNLPLDVQCKIWDPSE